MSKENDFIMDGVTYRPVFNELGEIGGCHVLEEDEVLECKDCQLEGRCPGMMFDEEDA